MEEKAAVLKAVVVAAALLAGCERAGAPAAGEDPNEPPSYITNETKRAQWRRMHDKEYLAQLEKQRRDTEEIAARIERMGAALAKARAENAPEGRILAISNQIVSAYGELDAKMKESQRIVAAKIRGDAQKMSNPNGKGE